MAFSLQEVFLFIGQIPYVNEPAEDLATECSTQHTAVILWISFESLSYSYIARKFRIIVSRKCSLQLSLSGLASFFILGAFRCTFYEAIC